MYRVLNIHSIEYKGDSFGETELDKSTKMVIIGPSYITLYQLRTKHSKLDPNVTFTFSNLRLQGITTIEDPILLECGLDEFEVYLTDSKHNNNRSIERIIHIATLKDDPKYKYLILQIEDTVYLHVLIQEI
jgi:hypothetical protein